ncbi:GspE/PulE family protein [Endothiovibrio diazotrophicus]
MQVSKANAAQPDHRLSVGEVVEGLVADGHLSAEQVATVARVHAGDKLEIHPLILVANRGWVSAKPPHPAIDLEFLTDWLGAHAGLPVVHVDPLKVDVGAVTTVVSQAYAQRFRILPLEVDAQRVVMATAEPFVSGWVKELAQILRREIQRVVINPADLNRYLGEFYGMSASVRKAARHHAERQGPAGLSDLEQLVELGRAGKLDANDRHVVSIVDWLLQYAFAQRASDIHLEPRREQCGIRFRIDGVMHAVYQLPASITPAVTSRLKILGRMDVAEKRRPQDGRIKTKSPDGAEIELRLSTMPTAFGEKLVMRIFNPEVLVKDYGQLGFSSREQAGWEALTAQGGGIVLVTGPTGSGKTTTLYSTLRQLATEEVNVCTVEDPIENVVPDFNQMQVQHNIGLDFAAGVRTLMRQDPDIIMVGEIRDPETAEMAVQAALTGHLVLSTLHTNDAASAVTRLLEIGVPAYLLKATLRGVLAQRLVRRLCPHCKAIAPLDEQAWADLVAPWKVNRPERIYRPVGCNECRQTGFLGRLGIYELLIVTGVVRAHIRPDTELAELRQAAFDDGMRPLRLAGARKVGEGLTTIEEVLKVAPAIREI